MHSNSPVFKELLDFIGYRAILIRVAKEDVLSVHGACSPFFDTLQQMSRRPGGAVASAGSSFWNDLISLGEDYIYLLAAATSHTLPRPISSGLTRRG
jgi:hypothetical protein